MQQYYFLTLAARKLPLTTLTPSYQRLLSPCRRILHKEGPGDNFASIIIWILPAASMAAWRESESVTLYRPTYLGSFPARVCLLKVVFKGKSKQMATTKVTKEHWRTCCLRMRTRKKGFQQSLSTRSTKHNNISDYLNCNHGSGNYTSENINGTTILEKVLIRYTFYARWWQRTSLYMLFSSRRVIKHMQK